MFCVNMNKGITIDVSHTGTAIDIVQVSFIDRDSGITFRITSITTTIDVTANGNLGLHRECKQTKQYYGYDLLHYSLTFMTGLSSSSSES